MSDDADRDQLPPFVTALGITGVTSAHERAKAALALLIDAIDTVLSAQEKYTTAHVVFQGLAVQAQGLHEGAVLATEAGNPYAAFTLLRAYSENAAAILYVMDHPTRLDDFWRELDRPRDL